MEWVLGFLFWILLFIVKVKGMVLGKGCLDFSYFKGYSYKILLMVFESIRVGRLFILFFCKGYFGEKKKNIVEF